MSKQYTVVKPITIKNHPVNIDLTSFIENEFPVTSSIVKSDIRTPSTNDDRMPLSEQIEAMFGMYAEKGIDFYELDETMAEKITSVMTRYATALHYATVTILYDSFENQKKYLYDPGTGMTEEHFSILMEMAKATINDPSFVGRFDTVVNPDTGVVEGVYEYNGDTPVLLAESVTLQNTLVEKVTGDSYHQSNHWWEESINRLKHRLNGKNVVVICDLNFMEEVTSYEVLSQMLDAAGANVYFDDHNQLRDDSMSLNEPFRLIGHEDVKIDYIFSLVPWEEMIQHGIHVFRNFKFWKDQTKLIEPAWKWVMGNKGLMAYITNKIENKEYGMHLTFSSLPHIPSYLTKEEAIEKLGSNFFSKPFNGRMSQGVSEWTNNIVSSTKDGYYKESRQIYQKPVYAHSLDGKNNFLVATWTGPFTHAADCLGLAFRIFSIDRPFMDWDTEYFAPHLIRGYQAN